MGKPEDDQDLAARAAADAELAHQHKVATEMLDLSATNLDSIASTMADEGYGDAAAVVHRAASQQLHEGVRHALQGEEFQEASDNWGRSSRSVEHEAKEMGQAFVGAAERRHALVALDQPSLTDTERANAQSAEAAIEAGMRAHLAEAAAWGKVAESSAEDAIQAEQRAHQIHPEVADDGATPEAPAAE